MLNQNQVNSVVYQDQSEYLANIVADAADDRKGDNIILLKLANISYIADYFVIITGFSRVQVRAIAESIQTQVKETLARTPLRVEGLNEASWVLQDYGDVMVHIFLPSERDFYNLEAFWGHADKIYFQSKQL